MSVLTYGVDKRTMRTWLELFHRSNDFRLGEYQEHQLLDVAMFSAELARNFIRCITQCVKTEEERTQIVEAATHGMTFALMQECLLAMPPKIEQTQETVN